ncbi:MAG TPA: hypothetical protein VGW34_13775 [Allosphingosinicella sp.]|nr:hypothetical protein [Allosphingosinicella sp.]
MPRVFFHVIDDLVTIDEEGVELPDREAVRRYAEAGARGLMCDQLTKGRLNLSHRIDAKDEKGRPVLTLYFRDVVTIEG